MRILVTERIADDGIEILKQTYGQENVDVDFKLNSDVDALIKAIGNYDGLVVRSKTPVNDKVISAGKNLKVIGRAGNGIDNIEIDSATQHGVIVVNTPEGNVMAAAELTIGHIFGICRNIPQANASVKKGDFRRNNFKGVEVYDKTLGIIGLGRIGSLVATRMKACGMKVIAYDPYIPDQRFEKFGVKKIEQLNDLVMQSDIITIHTPKTEETIGIVGEEQFKLMKKGIRLVNCARGGLINEDCLYENIKNGKVAAAAVDVLAKEPSYDVEKQDFENKLLAFPNVIITPHLGASTLEAQYNVGVSVAKQVTGALNGELVENAVNLPSLPKEELEELKAYLKLAENIGKVYFQTEKEPVDKIEITYSGDILDKNTEIITLAMLKGFLDPAVKEKVNYVNAKTIAKSRNIQVVESSKFECEHYNNLITVKFMSKSKEKSLSGTVFGKDAVRIIDFYGYKVDCVPEKYVLAIQNNDVPGVIGNIGTALGMAKINIAAMQVSRNRRGENAIMLLNIDSNIPKEVMELIRNAQGILKASVIKF